MLQDCAPLAHAIIDAFLFLENSGDSEVDPDSAVRVMENMSASLLKLSEADQLELRALLEKIADNEKESRPYRDFVRKLPDAIGLLSS